jgi:hypothetical protein
MIDPTRLDDVRDVLNRRKDEILRTYRAVGTGIGKQQPSDASYVIVVYLESTSDLPPGPVAVEGVSLKFEVTGPFKTQPS